MVVVPSVLGVFSGLGPHGGGIAASASIAWASLRSRLGADRELAGLCYGELCGPLTPSDGRMMTARSKTGAVAAALRLRGACRLILVWHLGLLKLLPLLRRRDTKTVLFLHGIEAWRRPGILTRRLLGQVDTFLTNSDHTWARFTEFNPALRSRPQLTVPLGVGAPVATAGEPDATPTAVMIGRLDRGEGYKGHREVISCWPQVLRRLPQARLWIVGEGDLLPELVRHVEQLGLGSCVAFWGWVSEEDKERLLTRSRCLALPSRGEGFGLVYAEAMRLGRPCLVGTEDAGREVVDPPTAGLAADPDDLCSLTDGLCRLMDDTPAWRSQSVQARKRYEKLFTAERFQERLLEALGLS